MFRRHVAALLLTFLVTNASIALVACGRSGESGSLGYSVVQHDGRVTATVTDSRSGKHTVWIVVSDASTGKDLGPMTSRNSGLRSGESQSCSVSWSAAPGTYDWSVYDVEGFVKNANLPTYARAHRVAHGRVVVP